MLGNKKNVQESKIDDYYKRKADDKKVKSPSKDWARFIEGWEQYNIWIISFVVVLILGLVYAYFDLYQNSLKDIKEVILWSDGTTVAMPAVWSRWLDLLLGPMYTCLFIYLLRELIETAIVSCIIGSILGIVLGFYFSLNFVLLVAVLNCLFIAIGMSLSMLFGLRPRFAFTFSICMLTTAIFTIGLFNGLIVGASFTTVYIIAALMKWRIDKIVN
jgi:hypothetical protein